MFTGLIPTTNRSLPGVVRLSVLGNPGLVNGMYKNVHVHVRVNNSVGNNEQASAE